MPCSGTVTDTTDNASPSASVSLVKTAIVAALFSAVVAASFTALGAAFVPVNGAPATQVVLPTIVPVTAWPELSPTVVPLPSFRPHLARRPGVADEISTVRP